MVENDEKHSKIMKKYLFYHVYERLMKKNEEKSLLVSNWEWLPKLVDTQTLVAHLEFCYFTFNQIEMNNYSEINNFYS